ncbi:hypothetical protein SDC9_174691 [bioreactor metagenome]|uniref:Uncharacterized protein n=1 Tax=bioreactor metagenome TaxID=1076179 RepID=A0A645GJX1_9ZZZZ
MVSTTAWQSSPAVNPGPAAMTYAASVIFVPRFRFAKIASTTAAGLSRFAISPTGSAITAISPRRMISCASFSLFARRAVISSTLVSPLIIASEKQMVRRMDVGCGKSVMTTEKPLLCRRNAMPVAMSPAPRTQMIIWSHSFSFSSLTLGVYAW